MENMEGTAQIRTTASAWSLAGDRQLLHLLNSLHQKITSKCEETNSKLQQMCSALDNASVSLQNVNNRFLSLSATQFIESRVYEDDTDTTQPDSKQETGPSDAINNNDTAQLAQSLARLELYHEPVHILPDSDSDSDTDSDTHTESVVFRLRDLYAERPLPHTIGTKQWKEKWHAGLIVEDSDTNSEGSAPSAAPLSYSSDEDGQGDGGTPQGHSRIWREEDLSSTPTAVPAAAPAPLVAHIEGKYHKSQSELAAEVARRLTEGIHAAPAPTSSEEPPPPAPVAAPATTLFRPQPPTRLTGAVFNDEPPPLDRDRDHDRDSDNDIFAELEDDRLFQKEDKASSLAADTVPVRGPPSASPGARAPDLFKKPVGAIPLFGDGRGSETIGDAILERTRGHPHRQQSSRHERDSRQPAYTPRKEENISSPHEQKKTGEDADLLSKAAATRPGTIQNYDIKDDLFDDIDDLFSTSIVNSVQVKEPDKSTPGLFDDDDLFADLDFGSFKNVASESQSKITDKTIDVKSSSIFEDDSEDDLFSDKLIVHVENKTPKPYSEQNQQTEQKAQSEQKFETQQKARAEQKLRTEQKAQTEQKPHTEQKPLPKALFDDDDSDGDLFLAVSKTDSLKKASEELNNFSNNALDGKSSENILEKVDNSKVFSSPLLFDDDDINGLFTANSVINTNTSGHNKQSLVREGSDKVNEEPTNKNYLENRTGEELNSDMGNIEKLSTTQNKDESGIAAKSVITRREGQESIVEADIFIANRGTVILKDVESPNLIDEKGLSTNTKNISESNNIVNQGNVTRESSPGTTDQNFMRTEKEEESPLQFDDDSNDIFRINYTIQETSKKIGALEKPLEKNQQNYTIDNPSTNDKVTHKLNKETLSAVQTDESLDDDEIFQSKNKGKDRGRDLILDHDIGSTAYDVANVSKAGVQSKPEIPQKPNPSTSQKDTPKNIDRDIFSDDELLKKQNNLKIHHKEDLSRNNQKSETIGGTSVPIEITSDKDDIFFTSSTDRKIDDIFHDVYSDQPPDFLKPVERKKSKNINALFDDDSDDEALFFKRNDTLVDEKLDETPVKDKSSTFGLFNDEPPDLDFDFQVKPKNSIKDKSFEQRNIDVEQVSSARQSSTQVENNGGILDDKNGDDVETPPSLTAAKADKHSSIDSLDFSTKIKEDVDACDGLAQSKGTKVVGKLKGVNIDIDVKALMPGASPKRKAPSKNTEKLDKDQAHEAKNEEETTEISNPNLSMARSGELDDNTDSSLLCNKLSKDRAKIQVKRRPSSRKARKEAVRKSGVFIENPDRMDAGDDITERLIEHIEKKDETKSDLTVEKTETTPDTDDLTINTLGKVYSKIMSNKDKEDLNNDSDEDIFGKTTRINIEKEKKITKELVAAAGNDQDLGQPTKSILSDNDDDDIFNTFSMRSSGVPELKRNATKEKKSLFDDLSDDELLFGPAPARDLDQRSRTSVPAENKEREAAAGGTNAQRVFDDPLSAFQDQ